MNNSSIRSAEIVLHCLFALKPCGFFTAPGSRNAPFSQTLDRLKLPTIIHFDERALGFIALGAAKASEKPAILITTSGTACGNLLPAVMEAAATRTRMIIVTADRPYELHDRGANQTCVQDNIFSSYAEFIHLPTLSSGISEDTIVQRIATALRRAGSNGKPLHINIELRAPLYGKSDSFQKAPAELNTQAMYDYYNPKVMVNMEETEALINVLKQKSSMILAGCLSRSEAEALYSSTISLGKTIIADIQSGLRGRKNVCSCYESPNWKPHKILPMLCEAKYIIIFGGRFLSQELAKYLTQSPSKIIFCSAFTENLNAFGVKASYLNLSCKALAMYLNHRKKTMTDPINHCLESEEFIWQPSNEHESTKPESFSEAEMVMSFATAFEHNLFIGNGQIIRYADAVFNASKAIFTNRGVSGIDGLIASACGVALTQGPTLAAIGDTSALYDISSLCLLKNCPVRLVIFNNNGGRIFEKFPLEDPYTKERLFVNPTNTNFSVLGEAFGIKTMKVKTSQELSLILKQQPDTDKGLLIECCFSPEQGLPAFDRFLSIHPDDA